MTNASKSIFSWGIYMLISGLVFLTIPNLVLPIFNFFEYDHPFIRIVGLLMILLSVYYFYYGWNNDEEFFKIAIYIRIIFPILLAILFFFHSMSSLFYIFPIVEILFNAWTYFALKNQ